MTVIDPILPQPAHGAVRTLPELLATVPELAADPHSADSLCLLSDGRWSLAVSAPTPNPCLIDSVRAYLGRISSRGACATAL